MNDRSVEENALLLLWSTLRSTFTPELSSALAKDRAKRSDAALLRLIAGYQHLPRLRDSFRPRYEELVAEARRLGGTMAVAAPRDLAGAEPPGDAADNPVFVGVPDCALRLESALLSIEDPSGRQRGPQVDAFVQQVAQLEADLRGQFESAVMNMRPVTAASLRSVTASTLEQYLRAHPQGSPDIRVKDVAEIPGGRSKRTILATLAVSAALPSVIVLRMDTDRGVGTSVRDEYPLLARVARHGLPVPEPLWLEETREPFGFPFIAFRRMPGRAAGDLIEGAFTKVPATGLALARTLAAIHAAGAALIEDAALRGPAAPHTRELLDGYYAQWRAKKPFPSPVIEAAFIWMRRHLEAGSGEASVVHGDTGFHNLLLDESGQACLLDWEFAHYGDGAEDLASCRPAVEQVMPWDDFLAAYQAHGGQPVRDFQLKYFEIWRPLRNAVACGTVLHSLMHGEADDIDPVTIGLSTFARLQADLARTLANIARTGSE